MPYRLLVHSILALLLLQAGAEQASWEAKNRAGEEAFQRGHLVEAQAFFLGALREAQKSGPEDARLAPIYNNLASISFVQSNFIDSETLYRKAIALMEAPGGQTQAQDNPLLLPVLDNLTILYTKEWDFGKALQTSWRAFHIREKKFGPASLDIAAGLSKLANLYFQSVRLLPQSIGENPASANAAPPQPADTSGASDAIMENAASPDDATKLAFAEALYRKALAIQERIYGDDNARLVDVLDNLAEVLEAEDKVIAAEEVNARTIEVVVKAYGPNDFRLALPMQHIAELKEEQGDLPGAEKLYARSLQISDSQSDTAAQSLTALLTDYADLLGKMHKPEDAKTLADRASALAAKKTAKNTKFSVSNSSMPYLLRFEKSATDRSEASRQTCILVRADGRFQFEEHHQDPNFRPTVPTMPKPDEMGGMGDEPHETFNDRASRGTEAPEVFESSLDPAALQQLNAILSASDIRQLQGSYPGSSGKHDRSNQEIAVSILREDGVQNFAFPDTSALRSHEDALKPLVQWLTIAEKHKGSAIKGAEPNNCAPETPKATPMQFSSARTKPTPEAVVASAAPAAANSPSQKTSTDNQNAVQALQIQSNLVLVRVVARDSQGHSIGTLQQTDFQLADNRKPREIVSFALETTNPETNAANATPPTTPNQSSAPGAVKSAETTLATEQDVLYLFDDLHLSKMELDQLRQAAIAYLSSSQAHVHAAILTTSGQGTLNFTADRSKITDALSRIDFHPAVAPTGNDCPDMDAYTANLIINKNNDDALEAITTDTIACAFGGDPRKASAAESMAKTSAQQQLAGAHTQDRIVLSALQNAFHLLLAAPGHRTLVLISPGFVVPDDEQDFDRAIDDALHSDIVINSLDARTLNPADSPSHPGTYALQYRQAGDTAKGEILSTLADATGGTDFHNNNDLAAGFAHTSGIPEYSYILGFSPQPRDLDGHFHTLKVTVKDQSKLNLQARKGYYARKP